MADPTHGPYGSPLLDNFNRADGDPGDNWVGTFYGGDAKPVISGNKIDTGADWKSMRWSTPTLSANCEVWGTPGNSTTLFLAARAPTINAVSGGCYEVGAEFYGSSVSGRLGKYVAGTFSLLAEGKTSAGAAPVALSCLGSLVQSFYWDGSSWVLINAVIDATFTAAGNLGADLYGTLDNFGGGWFADSLETEELELAYGYGPTDAAPVFISVDDLPGGRSRQRSFSFARTRSNELDRYDSFSANATLGNTDAALNPENTASPYTIKPKTPIRYTVNGVVMYYGYTGGFSQVYPNVADAIVPLSALDRLSLLTRRNFQGASVFAAGLSGQRFYDVLITELGYTAADCDLDAGTVTCAATADLIGTKPLDHLQQIALAEGGRFFCSRDGKFTFRDAKAVLEQFAVDMGTFGNENDTQIPFRLVGDEISHDASKIYNSIYITDGGGTVADAIDAASRADYDALDYNQTWPISAADAEARASRLLRNYKDPHLRIPALEILHTRNPSVCWPVISMLEIGQRFGFRYQPFAAGSDLIEMDVVVDGISIDSTPGKFKVTVQLAPADMNQYWLAGIAGFSEAGVTTVAW